MESPRPEGMEAPCQAGVDRTQEALDYSAAEVAEILEAMDAAKVGGWLSLCGVPSGCVGFRCRAVRQSRSKASE